MQSTLSTASHTHRSSGRDEALVRQHQSPKYKFLLLQNNVSIAAQHSPPQTVLTKLLAGPTLCAAWVGMHRHVTSRDQGSRGRERTLGTRLVVDKGNGDIF